jgi:ribosome-binding factor A
MSLVDELIRPLLEEEKKTVAVYGGGFKPPTAGHFKVVDQALKENPNIDEFIILIGGKERDGVSPEESLIIWDIYKQYLPIKVEVKLSPKPPIQAVYNYAKEHPDEEVLFVIGAREGNEDDFSDIAKRTKALDKYDNLELRTIVTQGGASGTAARSAAKISTEKLKPLLPKELKDEEVEEIFNILSDVVKENDPEDGKAAPYGSGYKKLNENASYKEDIDIQDKIDRLTQHMISKGMNIEPLPSLEFVDGDSENAKDFFGRTAYYDPNRQHIVLYTEGRHPKDIVRSYAHEMIHHIQNLEDRLGDIAGTDTTSDEHLDKLEQEANLKGTMTFRNWTDSLNEAIVGKKIKCDNCGWDWNIVDGGDDLFICHECGHDNEPINENLDDPNLTNQLKNYIEDHSDIDVSLLKNLSKIKNKFPKQLDPKVGGNEFGYRGTTFDKDFIKKLKVKSKSNGVTEYEVPSDLKITSRGKKGFLSFSTDEEVAKGFGHYSGYVDHKKSDSRIGGYVKISLDNPNFIIHPDYMGELSKDMEYSKESEKETLYVGDSFTPKSIFVVDKDLYKLKEDKKKDPFGLNAYARELAMGLEEEVDLENTPEKSVELKTYGDLKFALANIKKDQNLKKFKDIGGKAFSAAIGLIPGVGLVKDAYGMFKAAFNKPDNVKTNTWLDKLDVDDDASKIVDDTVENDFLKFSVDKFMKEPDDKVLDPNFNMDDELNNHLKKKFNARHVGGVNEQEKVDYKIYCDMDGVLADFESGYEKLTGVDLKGEFKKGDDFWDPIKVAGVGFWAGLKWMPDGQKLWDYIKPLKPEILSAPSREESSRIGKAVWVKYKLPGTKLILRYAKQKQELATPESILIDDRQVNIDQWEAAGGIGILHTSADNTISQLKELGL